MKGSRKSMSRALGYLVSAVFALAAARETFAARGTPYLDALAAALTARASDDQTPAALRKLYEKDLKLLAKPTTLVKEDVTTAAKIIPALEKKAGDDAALLATARTALDGFTSSVVGFLIKLDADAAALHMKADPLAKIDRYLGAAHAALEASQATGATLTVRVKALRTAVFAALKANEAIKKLT